MNNETIGISAEVAIANSFNVKVSNEYKLRSDETVVSLLKDDIIDIFNRENIPNTVKHVAEKQNPVDFILKDKTTLSVKTNKQSLKKVAPQIIGQPTSNTYFEYFKNILGIKYIPNNYNEKVAMFKAVSIERLDEVMPHYWSRLFECEHLIYFYNIIDKKGKIKNNYKYLYIQRPSYVPIWDKEKFYFTKNIKNWNESCTVKYYSSNLKKYISLGEFQVHNNRDCLKFRFNMKGVLKLIKLNFI